MIVEKRTYCHSKMLLKIFVIQWTCLLIMTILSYLFVGDFIQGLINSQLVVSPDSDIYSLWKQPPVNPEMKIYLFNLTNVKEWMEGSHQKLKLDQVGPFTYKETWKKKNITFNNVNSSVSFYLIKEYEFLADVSMNENAKIILPNIPLFSAAASMKNANSWSLMGFNAALNLMDQESKEVFIERTAKQIIWGYDDALSSMASFVLPPEEVGIPGKFGLLAGKNSSLGGQYTVDTGATNLKHLSQTIAYRGKRSFKAWRSQACNKVKGADGSFFPPWIHPTDILDVFVPDLCGSIPLASNGEQITFEPGNVKGLRFRPHHNTFRYDVPENRCYCTVEGEEFQTEEEREPEEQESWFAWSSSDKRRKRANDQKQLTCPDFGVFDLSSCKFGAPLFVSWPHFLNADKKFAEGLDGLHTPNEKDHGLRMDIQPTMGLALSASIRLQMNLKIEKSAVINKLANLPLSTGKSLLIPIMWFDDSIERPPEDLLILLGDALSTGNKISRGVLIFSALVLTGQLLICAAYIRWKKSGNDKQNQTVFFDEKNAESLKMVT